MRTTDQLLYQVSDSLWDGMQGQLRWSVQIQLCEQMDVQVQWQVSWQVQGQVLDQVSEELE